jgi:phosphoribosylglycinamide formyltransferase-1
MTKSNIVILISGNGSNLQAFIEAQKSADFHGTIAAVISNKADAYGIQRAKDADIPTAIIEHTAYSSREVFDQALLTEIEKYSPSLVILAGFMRILTPQFVTNFTGRLLNIHPSLLPKYPGLHTHRRSLENNDEFHGTSVHFVTEELDGGPVIAQSQTKILAQDTEESLLKRVQSLEHKLYPVTAKLLLDNDITWKDGDVYFKDKELKQPLLIE